MAKQSKNKITIAKLLKVVDQTVENGCNKLLLNDDEIRGLKSDLRFEIKDFLGDTNLIKNYTDYGIRMRFFNKADEMDKIKPNLDATEEFVSWLELSAFCLKGIIKYGANYNLIPCLKEEIANYVLESEKLYDIVKNDEGKISLWKGFAYFNLYSFKQLAYSSEWVLNGTRTFPTILEQMNAAYKEDSRMKNLFEYELYPFIEINNTDLVKIKLKDSSFYEKLYEVVKKKNPNWDKTPYVKNRLSVIYDIIKSDKNETENKWKSLLLTYIPEEISNKADVVTDTVEEPAQKVVEEMEGTDREEKSNNERFFILEKMLTFHYLTGYSDDALKDFSIQYGGINANSIDRALGRMRNFTDKAMSSKQLEQYKPSLEKIKRQLSSENVTQKIQIAISEIDKDIAESERLIETKRNEEEKAKKEKQGKKIEELLAKTK